MLSFETIEAFGGQQSERSLHGADFRGLERIEDRSAGAGNNFDLRLPVIVAAKGTRQHRLKSRRDGQFRRSECVEQRVKRSPLYRAPDGSCLHRLAVDGVREIDATDRLCSGLDLIAVEQPDRNERAAQIGELLARGQAPVPNRATATRRTSIMRRSSPVASGPSSQIAPVGWPERTGRASLSATKRSPAARASARRLRFCVGPGAVQPLDHPAIPRT